MVVPTATTFFFMLAYGWRCVASGDFTDQFSASVPRGDGTAVQRLRTAFADKPSLTVTEDSTGLDRVVGGTFKTDLLDLKIKRLVFHNEDDPMIALSSILDSPEVQAYLRQTNIVFVPEWGGIYPAPSKSSPHLNGMRENIRLSEALDLLPLTYSGMWGYRACACPGGKRMVAIHFLQWSVPPAH
jgi:hypothetical protein